MNIFTIGYEGLTLTTFIAWLKRFDVSFVADVRHLPLSRKKGFSKTAMSELLASENIIYQSYKELGTSKSMREKLYQDYDYDTFFSEYSELLEHKKDRIADILNIVQSGHNVALLCFEKDAEKCHRKIIAQKIKLMDGNGMAIKHIASPPLYLGLK